MEQQGQENIERFSNAISTRALEGYRILDRNDRSLKAVLEKSGVEKKEFNHTLHLVLTVFTCVWGIVWLILFILHNKNKDVKGKRLRISIDSQNNLIEEEVNI